MTFADALREAMTARGYNIIQTAQLAGLNSQTVSNILRGLNHPLPSSTARLAAALDAPELMRLTERSRRRRCPCGQRFTTVHRDPNRRRFCSARCQEREWARLHRYTAKAAERINGYKLRDAMRAVEKFCTRCVGDDRACPDSRCELREFSPYPVLIQLTRKAA